MTGQDTTYLQGILQITSLTDDHALLVLELHHKQHASHAGAHKLYLQPSLAA